MTCSSTLLHIKQFGSQSSINKNQRILKLSVSKISILTCYCLQIFPPQKFPIIRDVSRTTPLRFVLLLDTSRLKKSRRGEKYVFSVVLGFLGSIEVFGRLVAGRTVIKSDLFGLILEAWAGE